MLLLEEDDYVSFVAVSLAYCLFARHVSFIIFQRGK